MADPRLSMPPPSPGRPILVVVVLVGLALVAAALTVAVYRPDTSEARGRPTAPQPAPPAPLLVDEPRDLPEEDDGGAEVAAEPPPPRRRAKRRRRLQEGTIDRRRLAAFMKSKLPRLRQCYERRLRQDHLLRGTLVPQIRIHPSGSVMNVNVTEGTLRDRDVRACVARMIRSWRFPRPEGGAVTVANPLRFEPRTD